MSRIDPGGRAGRRPTLPGWLMAVPVAVAAGAVALGLLVGPASSPATPAREVRLDRGSYACPGGLATVAGQVAPASEATAQSFPAVRSESSVPAKARSVTQLAGRPGTWRRATTPAGSTVVTQLGRGTGPLGFVSGRASQPDGGGLVVAGCPGVADDAWFPSLGSGSKHQSTLLLTNTADTPAAATVDLWNTEGVVDAIDNEGIVVPAGASRRIRLADLAAGEKQLAAHVTRLRGALTVSVLDTSTAVYRGTDLTMGGMAPTRRQWVPGLSAGVKRRTLSLVNPGQTTARVKVTVLSARGRFVPEGLSDLKVRSGRLREVTLPASVGSGAATLQLTSDVPVVAGVRLEPDTVDFARAESVPPLDGTAGIPLGLAGTNRTPRLLLAGVGAKDSSVELTAYDASMKRLDRATVTVRAGRTQDVSLAKAVKIDGAAYVLVRATGDVVGAASYTNSGRVASLPLLAAPVRALGPHVSVVGP